MGDGICDGDTDVEQGGQPGAGYPCPSPPRSHPGTLPPALVCITAPKRVAKVAEAMGQFGDLGMRVPHLASPGLGAGTLTIPLSPP